MVKMFLDDIRQPWNCGCIGWELVKTADEAIAMLQTGQVEIASLDHDLAEEHYPWNCTELPPAGAKTGYDVVCFLESNPHLWPVGGVRVHSMNTAGKYRMCQVIYRHYGQCDFW